MHDGDEKAIRLLRDWTEGFSYPKERWQKECANNLPVSVPGALGWTLIAWANEGHELAREVYGKMLPSGEW